MNTKFYRIFKTMIKTCHKSIKMILIGLFTILAYNQANAQYLDSIPKVCNGVTGGTEVITHLATPAGAVGSATLKIDYEGDFASTGEFLEVYSENGGFLIKLNGASVDCNVAPTATLILPQDSINLWAADGSISFTYTAANATTAVNNICGPSGNSSFCITPVLSYFYATVPNNAGVVKVDSPVNFCPGFHNVVATIMNAGTNQLDSVRVNWTFNGAPRPTIYYNTLLDTAGGTGANTATIILGNENFIGGVNHEIKVWTSMPNGVQDTVNTNDSITVFRKNNPTCPLAKDVGVVAFTQPASYTCGFSTQTQVCLKVTNYGYEAQWDIPVSYRIFFTVVATEIITDTIQPGATLEYCFTKTADLTLPALYPFSAWTDLPGEMKRSNDTIPLNYPVVTSSIRQNFPYLVTFDLNPGGPPAGWINAPENTEDWKFNRVGGNVPNNIPFDHTFGNSTGHYAWIDDNTPHTNSIKLLTQCLDFTVLTKPYLEFYLYNSDTATATSTKLYVDILDNDVWVQVAGPLKSNIPTEWELQEVNLTQYAGQIVKIRFRGSETGSSSDRDLAIDDVKIYNLGPVNLHVTQLVAPQSECDLTDIESVTIAIRQKGSQTLLPGTTIPVSFQVNNGFIVNEIFTLTDTLFTDSITTFTFNAPADLSAAGTYLVKTWAKHPLDNDYTNDTLSKAVSDFLVSSFPYMENFESFIITEDARGYENFWRTSPSGDLSKYRWNVHTGFTPSANTGPLGDHTTIDGNYIYTEANQGTTASEAYVYTPCFDLSKLTNPGLNFYYNMFGTGIGELHVDAIIDTVVFLDIMPPLVGEKGQEWQLGVANLNNFANEVVSFRFRAVRGSNTLGDIAIDDFRIGELPLIGLGDTIRDCGTIILDAGINTASYKWSTGGTERFEKILGDPVNPVTKNVTLIVTNSSGMSNIDNVVVMLAPGPVVDLGPDVLICDSTSATLDAGNPGMNYLWNNGASTQTRTVTTSGKYYVAVSNGLCTKTDTINVTFGPGHPTGSFTSDVIGNQVFFNSNISGNVDSFYWDFGNNYFSYNANPNHYYLDSGSYTVKLIIINDCGRDTITQSVSVFGVGIEDLKSVASLNIKPNPTDGIFNISMTTENISEMEISILNVNGQVIETRNFENIGNKFNQAFDLQHLSNGIYFIRVNTNKDLITKKLIKQ